MSSPDDRKPADTKVGVPEGDRGQTLTAEPHPPSTRLGVGANAVAAQGDAPTELPEVVLHDARDLTVGSTVGSTARSASGSTGVVPLEGRVDALALVLRDNYEVISELGRGGLGRVLRARDRRTGRIVAIKEVLRATPGLLARFAREAIVTANLQHPAIVPVYEVGRWPEGEPFYAMKAVAGTSLAEAARRAKTLEQRLALLPNIIAVADALAYAHGERVIHRDLKPANVLIGAYGETVVIDWGLAKRLDDIAAEALVATPQTAVAGAEAPTEGQTIAGSVLGTPGYMPPEQARGDVVDERADVYAIGAMLYEVLCGVRPYAESDGGTAILVRVINEPPRPLAELAPSLPADLVKIVERAMAQDPAQRYRTAKPLAEDLTRYATGQLVGAQRYTAWMLVRRWVRRHRAVVAVAGAALAMLAVVGAIGVVRIQTERDHALAARHDAEDRAAALAEEQGRQLTTAGDAPRGLPFLADAIARGRDSAALRFVLARALDRIAPIEAVLTGSTAPINYLAYSPDGNQLVAAGGDNQIRLWDPHAHTLIGVIGKGPIAAWSPNGAVIATVDADENLVLLDAKTRAIAKRFPPLPDHDEALTIAFSPDSSIVALGGSKGHVAWYPIAGGNPIILAPHTADVAALAFSPDGALLGAGSQDRSATVWTVATGIQRATLHHTEGVRDIAFDPTSHRVLTAAVDGTVVEWDLDGKQLRKLAGHTNSVESARYGHAGALILTASSDHRVIMWDAKSGQQLWAADAGSSVIEARFDHADAKVAARTEHGDIYLWTTSGEQLGVLSGHVSSIGDIEWSPDDKQLASGGLDGDVRLWRPGTSAVQQLATSSPAWRGAWSDDGTRIAVTSKDGVLRVFDGAGAPRVQLVGHTAEITCVAFAPHDAMRVASASVDATVRVWDLGSGSAVTLAANAGRVRWLSFSHDGHRLATTHEDGTLRVWDVTTHAALRTIPPPPKARARRGVWSPDDAKLLVPLDGGGAALYDATTGAQLALMPLGGTMTVAAAWRNDGAELAIATDSTALARFDREGKLLGALAAHTLPIQAVEYAPDGSSLSSAGEDGVIRLWQNGVQRNVIGDAQFRMSALTYRPDGALIASTGIDTDVYDLHTGQLVGVLAGHPEITNSSSTELHWSSDGTRLLVLSLTLPPRLWTIPEWHGNVDELAKRLRCTLRQKLEDARLVFATPDPTACR